MSISHASLKPVLPHTPLRPRRVDQLGPAYLRACWQVSWLRSGLVPVLWALRQGLGKALQQWLRKGCDRCRDLPDVNAPSKVPELAGLLRF